MDSAANKASGALSVFYLIPLAVMYSATHVERFDESRRCLNGHRVSPLAKFCEECGGPGRYIDARISAVLVDNSPWRNERVNHVW
jgi:hypothetical protein